jgi:ABC-type transport system involved in Fe-S cluster assembly fused permease/ATPase subunit
MDLEKVMSLEGRIYNEMQQAQTKMKQMQDDMKNKFTKTDSLREQFEEEK